MSKKIGKVVIIEAELDMICHVCGKIDETRPYGPEGAEVCHDCGMKDPWTVEYQMGIRLFGQSETDARTFATQRHPDGPK